jgi:ABC-type phosphate transport system substrate-binding protein
MGGCTPLLRLARTRPRPRSPTAGLAPVVQEFLRFIHSKQGQQIVKKDGFVPLNQALFDETRAAYEAD